MTRLTDTNTPNTTSSVTTITPTPINNPVDKNQDQRRFTRVPFVSHMTLRQGQHTWQGNVVDISFNGALVEATDLPINEQSPPLNATLTFEDNSSIELTLRLAHHHQTFYGFCFSEIDSDSLTRLRNIISLNLGDAKACERELASLFSYHQ